MPRWKKSGTFSRRLNVSRRSTFTSRKKRNRLLSLINSPLPRKLTTKVRYVETFSMDPGAGGLSSAYVFSANGLYDPNITGTGHQPRGFDQLMTMYDHYVVTGSKIKVKLATTDSVTQDYIVGIALRDGATTDTDPNDYLEGGYCNWSIAPGGAGSSAKSLSHKTNIGKFLGRSKVMSDPELKGNAGSNPAEQCYYHVIASSLQLDNPTAIYMVAEIEYIVTFIEPKDVAQS